MSTTSAPTLDDLTNLVSDQAGRLESPAEATAVLESLGYTDELTRDMGWDNTFELGLDVFENQAESPASRRYAVDIDAGLRKRDLDEAQPDTLRRFLPQFALKGFTFGAPMVLMLMSVLTLLYSLWAYQYFPVTRGSAIGVGILGSYLVTAGFMQAIGRRGLMYLRQGMNVLSMKITLLLVGLGFVTVIVAAGFLWLFLETFPVLAHSEVPIALVYFFSMSCLWLGLSIVYMLQQEIWFSIAVAIGIGVVYFCREYLHLSIVVSHQAGIMSAAVFGLLIGVLLLARLEFMARRNRKEPLAGRLPRLSVIVYATAPYFLYGVLYFALLFTDRLLAWTGKTGFRQSFVWFQSDYEVGLNWALVSLLLSFSVLEFTTYRLGQLLRYLSQVHLVVDVRRFTGELASFYRRSVGAYIGAALIGIAAAYIGVRYLLAPHVPIIRSLIDHVAIITFFVSAVAYLLIVWALLNNVFLFSFSRPSFALRGVLPALLVNLIVGFLCSRIIAYWGAVFGLLAGAIVFWLISTYYAVRMLKDMDYYAYSAF